MIGDGVRGSAVIATSPPKAPLSIITTSVLPPTNLETAAQTITPAQAARLVLINIVAIEVESSKDPKANCEPPLNPNHPSHKINTPSVAKGIEELAKGSIALGSPVSVNLPSLGPRSIAPASAAAPPAL